MDAKAVTGMRDAGRSWTEIAERARVTVPEAKRIVGEAHAQRRDALAHSRANEELRGFLVPCAHCTHEFKAHAGEDHAGECSTCGPEVEFYTTWDVEGTVQTEHATRPSGGFYVMTHDRGCSAFERPPEKRRSPLIRYGRFPNDINLEAHRLGVFERRALSSRRGGPSVRAQVRRARRRVAGR